MLAKKETPYIKHNILCFFIDYKWYPVLRDIGYFENDTSKKLNSISKKNMRSALILYAYLVHIPVKAIALNFGLSQTRIREIIKSSITAINKSLVEPINIDLIFLEKENRLLGSRKILYSNIESHFKAKTSLLAIVINLLGSAYISRSETNMFYQLNIISKQNLTPVKNLQDIEENILTKKLYIEKEKYDQFILDINNSIKFDRTK